MKPRHVGSQFKRNRINRVYFDNYDLKKRKLKVNIITHLISREIFNYIGAMIRFIIGTIYRKILNKNSYTFKEYLNGPKEEGKNYTSYNNKNQDDNRFIASLFIIVLFYIIYEIFK